VKSVGMTVLKTEGGTETKGLGGVVIIAVQGRIPTLTNEEVAAARMIAAAHMIAEVIAVRMMSEFEVTEDDQEGRVNILTHPNVIWLLM